MKTSGMPTLTIPDHFKVTNTRGKPGYKSVRYSSRSSKRDGWDIANELAYASHMTINNLCTHDIMIFEDRVEIKPF